MTQVLVSAGSNRKDPRWQVQTAFNSISNLYAQARMSRLYLTQPVGPVSQEAFVNAVISFNTNQSAPRVLQTLLNLESRAGRSRNREIPQGPRNLDLDIILFGTEIWSGEQLRIPHPRFRERRFVLEPAAEIAATAIDPVSGKDIARLLSECPDTSWINTLDEAIPAL